MLLKLIKYDIKATYAKIMITFAAFTLLCIIVPPVLVHFQKGAALIFVALTIPFGIMALFILTFVFLFQRYNSNLYSSEGYLMFTLPTRGRKLLASKLIVAFIWTAVGTVVMAGALGVMFYVLSTEPEFLKVFPKIMGNLEFSFSQIVIFTVSYIISTALFFLEIYFAISVSKLPLWHKCGVLMGFVTYFGVNIVESIPNWLYGGTNAISQSISKSVIKSGNINLLHIMAKSYTFGNVWVDLLTGITVSVALFIATSLLLEKKTSLK